MSSISTLGLVSVNHLESYLGEPAGDLDDRIVHRCLRILDAQGCDTVLFALPYAGTTLTGVNQQTWKSCENISQVFLGTSRRSLTFWTRERPPMRMSPVEGVDARSVGQELVRVIPQRVQSHAMALFGTDMSALTLRKIPSRTIESPEGWEDALNAAAVRVFLNPLETYVRRWELVPKRQFCSRADGRTFVSVWNRTTVGESALRWTVHTGGLVRTGEVVPVRDSAAPKHITLGVLDMLSAAR